MRKNKISFTDESWIKCCLHYFTLYRIDISGKSDFQKDLLLLKTLHQDLQNFHQIIYKGGTLARDFISDKPKIYLKNKMFCSNISYLASSINSPSVKSIMLAMQYSKGTLLKLTSFTSLHTYFSNHIDCI